jgi:hypothetical protein
MKVLEMDLDEYQDQGSLGKPHLVLSEIPTETRGTIFCL